MTSKEEVEEFIRLVDQVSPQIHDLADLSVVADTFGLQKELMLGEQAIRNALFQLIRDEVVDLNGAKILNIRTLKSALVRRFRFHTASYAYHEVPKWILFGVNERAFRPLSENDRWLKAIRATYALMAIPGHAPSGIGDERDVVVVDAAKRLQSMSYKLGLDGVHLFFEDGELDRCCSKLNQLISKIGGAFVASKLLQVLQVQGKFSHDRYLVGRRDQPIPSDNSSPSIPFGYLLNLSLRHMGTGSRMYEARDKEALFMQLITLARDVVAIVDIETYSTYGFMFADQANLPRYLQGVMLGDFCLSFRQIVPEDAVAMMRGLFNWVDSGSMKNALGWAIEDALNLAQVLTRVPSKAISVDIKHDTLVKASGCSLETLQRMLPHFTHKTTVLNAQFHTPVDAAATTFDLKPFIWKPGNRILLLAPPLCSIGFFEALVTATRGFDEKNADNNIGLAIEPMLAGAFQNHGITPSVVSGKYEVGKKIYDCDLAVVSTDAVILFEIKKKALTKASMGGHTLDELIDLCRSMIKAQTQLGRQEIELRKAGEIRFKNGSHIELGNRRVERIAVTLFDWGSMQDRLVSDTVLKILSTSNIEATNLTTEQSNALNESQNLLTMLQAQMIELALVKEASNQPFFDCHFLGIPQLLFLLNGTRSADEFYANLGTIKHTVTRTLDMYHTLIYMKKLRASTSATATAT